MINSSTLGSLTDRRRRPKKVYPEKLCSLCGESFVPKNYQAAKHRYFCYGWKCETIVEAERSKVARERAKARKELLQASVVELTTEREN